MAKETKKKEESPKSVTVKYFNKCSVEERQKIVAAMSRGEVGIQGPDQIVVSLK
jgi:hypothetical protein